MKTHILYAHATKYPNKSISFRNINNGPTVETSSLEISDADKEMAAIHTQFQRGATYITETIENSDADEFQLQGPTTYTFSIENSDDDEFIASSQMNNQSADFDDILFL